MAPKEESGKEERMEKHITEVIARPDITRAARGFAYKKYLGKNVEDVKRSFDAHAHRKLRHHSTMDDGRDVYHGVDTGGDHHYMVVHHGEVQAAVNASRHGKSHSVEMAVAKPGANVHHLYHHLITKHDHILTSKEQSPGGHSVWKKLDRMGGVNIHGFHAKTGRGERVDIHDPTTSHVSSADLRSQLKAKGGTRAQRKREYADLKKTQSMVLVAHKDRNKRPKKAIRESAAHIVLRVIGESL